MGVLARVNALALLVLALACPVPTQAAPCRVERPVDWGTASLRWEGACVKGQAQGRGVLRGLQDGKLQRAFYGCMAGGHVVFGVLELPGGFKAGEFHHGQLRNSDDRALLMRAFDEASAAARDAAARYRKAGNAASARYYQDKAKQLAEQMD